MENIYAITPDGVENEPDEERLDSPYYVTVFEQPISGGLRLRLEKMDGRGKGVSGLITEFDVSSPEEAERVAKYALGAYK